MRRRSSRQRPAGRPVDDPLTDTRPGERREDAEQINADVLLSDCGYERTNSPLFAIAAGCGNHGGHCGMPGCGVAVSEPRGPGGLRGARHLGGRYRPRAGSPGYGGMRAAAAARLSPGQNSGGWRTCWPGQSRRSGPGRPGSGGCWSQSPFRCAGNGQPRRSPGLWRPRWPRRGSGRCPGWPRPGSSGCGRARSASCMRCTGGWGRGGW